MLIRILQNKRHRQPQSSPQRPKRQRETERPQRPRRRGNTQRRTSPRTAHALAAAARTACLIFVEPPPFQTLPLPLLRTPCADG